MPIVGEIKSPIGLFACDRLGYDQRSGGLISECRTGPQAVAEQEIGNIAPAGCARGVARQTLRPGTIERNESAPGVGLKIVIVSVFELAAEDEGVASADHGRLRRKIDGGIEIRNRALPLAAA